MHMQARIHLKKIHRYYGTHSEVDIDTHTYRHVHTHTNMDANEFSPTQLKERRETERNALIDTHTIFTYLYTHIFMNIDLLIHKIPPPGNNTYTYTYTKIHTRTDIQTYIYIDKHTHEKKGI